VTGSEGVVGAHLIKMLASRGVERIVCLDLKEGPTPEFTALAEQCRRDHRTELAYVKKDISSVEDMSDPGAKAAFTGVDVVFHLAALVGPYHKHEAYEAVNHLGAKNVLEAFVLHGGSRNPHRAFVDCSTPSTRYAPSGSMNGVMEHEISYQDTIHEYASSKARGEEVILKSNGRSLSDGSKLATCAVAPHQVYAPEDALFLPSMLQSAEKGWLRIFGNGDILTSFTHADNISHGLILAAARLWQEGPQSAVAAEFFVVTDTGAQSFWDVINDAIVECGLPSLTPKARVSEIMVWLLAYGGVVYKWLTGKTVGLTPFTVRMLLINRTFCTAKARHILGYAPVVSFSDGWSETMAAAKARLQSRSKAA